jgi:hypothetical protein
MADKTEVELMLTQLDVKYSVCVISFVWFKTNVLLQMQKDGGGIRYNVK